MRWLVAASVVVLATLGASNSQAAEVTVQQWIEPDRDIVARRQVDLYVEVATDGFFAGGTRIGEFEIPGVVVLRREQFAVNSTRITDGTTWAVQRWKIALYPQQPGRYQVPAISVRVISGSTAQPIEAATQPFDFSARLPDGLKDSGNWVAVPRLEVMETYDRPDTGFEALKAGDAVVRVVQMNASDTVAMMLPDLKFTAPDGVSIYRDPPRLEDSVNRGVSRSSRQETITYVIEKAGHYSLPEIEILWWDTEADELVQHNLAARSLATSGFADDARSIAPASAEVPVSGFRLSYLYPLAVPGSLLLALLGLGWIIRRARGRHSDPSLDQQLDRAVRGGDARTLVALLYRWLDAGLGREMGQGKSDLKGKSRLEAHTLRGFIATLDQADIESARVDVMQAGFRKSCGSGAIGGGGESLSESPAPDTDTDPDTDPRPQLNLKTLRTLRRMTRRGPGVAVKASAPFALN